MTISIYSATWCSGCDVLKNELDRLNIPYINKDIDNEIYLQEIVDYNIKGIPFTVISNINGDSATEKTFIGSSPEKIKQIVEAANG